MYICILCDIKYSLTGQHAGSWFVDLKQGAGLAGRGPAPLTPDVVMSMDSALFSRMFRGNHGNHFN